MFGTQTLDVVIGIAVVFFLFSLLVSAVREAFEAVIKTRAVHLELGIRELLDDAEGSGLAAQLYKHPQLFALYHGTFTAVKNRFRGTSLPAYIPARQFAVALMDLVAHGPVPEPGSAEAHYDAERTHARIDVDLLRAGVKRLNSPLVRRAVLNAIDQSNGDLASIQANLESWFNGTMDRVSGWYKRNTQYWLAAIGLFLAVAMNVNTLTIAEYLSRNEAARNALVDRASEISREEAALPVAEPAPAATADDERKAAFERVRRARTQAEAFQVELASTSIPIGWDRFVLPQSCVVTDGSGALKRTATRLLTPGETCRSVGWYLRQIFGLLMTAVAACLGAPFWFDILNKVMVIRSTVKPREKSQEEGSEDRRQTTPTAAPAAPIVVAAGSSATPQGPAPPPPAAGDGAAAMPSLPFEPQQWANGTPDEGVL